ncbi:endonuclease/exonuclease/phosphatase family protein [Flagellimonas flava]|nr:endonuclease/exonuclease/phosphatase family protein [Allomuricauda flava]
MSYNVMGFNKHGWLRIPDVEAKISDLIVLEDPDVICIQEYNETSDDWLDTYPYRRVAPYSRTVKRTIQAILSKYPIINNGSLNLPQTSNNIIYADLVVSTDTIRVYNTHLESFKIVPSSRTFSSDQSEKNYKRLVSTFAKQQEQVKILNEHRAKSPYKTIVCGDFNNTQFSHVYKTVSGGLNDSFLEKGNGFGKTYSLKGFPLRIDYILTDPEFEVIAHKNYTERLSDHYPIMATLRLKK